MNTYAFGWRPRKKRYFASLNKLHPFKNNYQKNSIHHFLQFCRKYGTVSNFRRGQAQGIQVCRLIYLSEEEFEFLKVKRVDFLKRVGYFLKKPSRVKKVFKKEALRGFLNEDSYECASNMDEHTHLKVGIDNYTPCYESTNIHSTRDSLFWSWRRVSEYFRDL